MPKRRRKTKRGIRRTRNADGTTQVRITDALIMQLLRSVEARKAFTFLAKPPQRTAPAGATCCNKKRGTRVNLGAIRHRLASLSTPEQQTLKNLLQTDYVVVHTARGKRAQKHVF